MRAGTPHQGDTAPSVGEISNDDDGGGEETATTHTDEEGCAGFDNTSGNEFEEVEDNQDRNQTQPHRGHRRSRDRDAPVARRTTTGDRPHPMTWKGMAGASAEPIRELAPGCPVATDWLARVCCVVAGYRRLDPKYARA